MDAFQAHGEGYAGHLEGLFDPEGRLVSEGEMDGPTGLHIGHGQGVAELTGKIATIVLDQVDLERARGSLCVIKPGDDRDSAMEEADRFCPAGAVDFHLLLWFLEQSVDSPGADFFELCRDQVGHGVGLHLPYDVEVLPQEGREELSALPVELFPEKKQHIRHLFVVIGLVNTLFPALFDDFDVQRLAADAAELGFPNAVQLENRVFPTFAAGKPEIFIQKFCFFSLFRFSVPQRIFRRNLFLFRHSKPHSFPPAYAEGSVSEWLDFYLAHSFPYGLI
jgi:hypothetical protein